MIDWKYGFYRLFWWLGFFVSMFLVLYFVKARYSIMVVTIFATSAAYAGCLYIFEKKHPYFQEKKRQSTIRYFRLICSTIIAVFLILYLIYDDDPTSPSFVPIYMLAISNIIPSFFTEIVPTDFWKVTRIDF